MKTMILEAFHFFIFFLWLFSFCDMKADCVTARLMPEATPFSSQAVYRIVLKASQVMNKSLRSFGHTVQDDGNVNDAAGAG
jgi:hypothetical protein